MKLLLLWEIVIVMLRGRPILLITRMITDRIGLHSVLLPLFIIRSGANLYPPYVLFLGHVCKHLY